MNRKFVLKLLFLMPLPLLFQSCCSMGNCQVPHAAATLPPVTDTLTATMKVRAAPSPAAAVAKNYAGLQKALAEWLLEAGKNDEVLAEFAKQVAAAVIDVQDAQVVIWHFVYHPQIWQIEKYPPPGAPTGHDDLMFLASEKNGVWTLKLAD